MATRADNREPLPHAKAVLIGAMNVGKTALSNRACHQLFEGGYQMTIAVGYFVFRATVMGRNVELQLWDTAGMERYSALGPIYYQGADVAIFVYDVTNPDSATDLDTWFQGFTNATSRPYYGIVVANKIDLQPDADSAQMERWAEERKLGFVKTSAKTGENVDALFTMAVQGAFLVRNNRVFEKASATGDKERNEKKCCE
jgi:small GTP-binding protein